MQVTQAIDRAQLTHTIFSTLFFLILNLKKEKSCAPNNPEYLLCAPKSVKMFLWLWEAPARLTVGPFLADAGAVSARMSAPSQTGILARTLDFSEHLSWRSSSVLCGIWHGVHSPSCASPAPEVQINMWNFFHDSLSCDTDKRDSQAPGKQCGWQ